MQVNLENFEKRYMKDNGDAIFIFPEKEADGRIKAIRLNQTGEEIVELLKNDLTLDELVDALHEKYIEFDREIILDDTNEILEQLDTLGLLSK